MTLTQTPRESAAAGEKLFGASDPITLEVLRNRLEAIGEEAGATLERTAISPVVVESKDYSCTILDADGRLVIGTGQVVFHYGAARNAVQSTITRHLATLAPGDVFISNDPHDGGGLHPGDVMVQQPVFVGDRLVAWAAISAHMMDIGGMIAGSFAPAATECYQEGLRLPPVRLFRAGEENLDLWDVIRTNVRISELVEMDLRSLVAGCHVVSEELASVVAELGVDEFVACLGAIRDLTEREVRRRVELLEDGVYRATTWAEWNDEFYVIPCSLTVDGDRLVFDYEGTAPQAPHFFNSKPYIVESELAALLHALLARDLPYNEGIFAPLELRCPEGSVVNSKPPAAIGAAHIDVALNAAEVGTQCVRLAVLASADHPARTHVHGWGAHSALGLTSWSGTGIDGNADAFLLSDGNWTGSTAGRARDGLPLTVRLVGPEAGYTIADAEVLESWYPILIKGRRERPGPDGAGTFHGGGGNEFLFKPHGTAFLEGAMFGMRRWLPLEGAAGGMPGGCTAYLLHRLDGSVESVATHAVGIRVEEGETFEFHVGSGGGWGDPLDRDPATVVVDVGRGRLSVDDARDAYGVVVDGEAWDDAATTATRDRLRRARLDAARPPARPVDPAVAAHATGDALPLYPGVVQRGGVALAEVSGTPLAVAPDHWTDGCAVLTWRHSPFGPPVHVRAYLDPSTGRSLFVEVVPGDLGRVFEVAPRRWTAAIPA